MQKAREEYDETGIFEYIKDYIEWKNISGECRRQPFLL